MKTANQRATFAYGKAQECVPQPWMVAILLKGAINHLEAAERAFADGRRADSMKRASKAIAILQGLRDNLRPEVSRPLTTRLDQFYGTTILQIAHLTRSGFDAKACAGVTANIQRVQDAWAAGENKGSGKD
ncbi:MAG: flagellar protein FliS [Rhodospirillales bacterium]|nr:flagellar protein FliS [Rhodospirillales bacterium]